MKFIPLFLGLVLPLSGAFAASGNLDKPNQQIIADCQKGDEDGKPGIYITASETVNGRTCEYHGCGYAGANNGWDYDGDNERVTSGCDKNKLRQLAKDRAIAQVRAAQAAEDRAADERRRARDAEADRINRIGSATSGTRDGALAAGASSGASAGASAGVAAGASAGASSGVASGAGPGGGIPAPGSGGATITTSVAGAGAGNGPTSGAGPGVSSGAGAGANGNPPPGFPADGRIVRERNDGGLDCYYLTSGFIPKNGLCYKECKRVHKGPLGWLGIGKTEEGEQRRSCVRCVMKYPERYIVRDDVRRAFEEDSRNGVQVGPGIRVVTGEVCYDANGREVSRTTAGARCNDDRVPSRSSGGAGGNGNGNGGGGSVTVVRDGGNGRPDGNGGGSVTVTRSGDSDLPVFCQDGRRYNRKSCERWMSENGRRFDCSSGSDDNCGVDRGSIYTRRTSQDCPTCRGGRRSGSSVADWLGGIAAIGAGTIAPIAVSAIQANGQARVARIGADAHKYTVDACQTGVQNYLAFGQSNELVAPSPSEFSTMNSNCNGSSYSGYAGLGGIGGLLGSGYSNGFIGGMMGPYGGYNPYGVGGGIMGTTSGGLLSGLLGGGGINGVALINGGIGGIGQIGGTVGYISGTMGGIGYINGGMGGSIGVINGGINGGIGYINGGMGGINGGIGYINGGMGGVGYINGGMGGVNGYINGGMGGVNGYINGGINGGGYNNTAAYSQLAMNRDAMLQQQGAAYQMSAMSGASAYNPYQVGIMGSAGLNSFGF